MNMLRTILIALVLAATIGGIAAAVVVQKTKSLNAESRDFTETFLQGTISNWDVEGFFSVADEARFKKENGGEEEIKKFFALLQKLGKLRQIESMDGHAGVYISFDDKHERVVSATYDVKATFDNDVATIGMVLAKKDGAWKLAELHINAPTLVTSQQSQQAPEGSAVPEAEVEPTPEE